MAEATNEEERKTAVVNLLKEMETTAAGMRDLILSIPPEDLLGYIYAQHLLNQKTDSSAISIENSVYTDSGNQFLLEYVHAVLASNTPLSKVEFSESQCAELFTLSTKLQEQAMTFALISSANTENDDFGPNTADIEFQAKSTWVLLRGNRYQVLEGEFYHYVLAPHNDMLKEIYGVSATEISQGFQDLTQTIYSGQSKAMAEIANQYEAAMNFAAKHNRQLKDVMEEWVESNKEQTKITREAFNDMLRGGIANITRHTRLPPDLLADLAYQRGEETEFFAEGDFTGTPYRTLPARKKPLVKLGSDYYAVDPCFIRDAGYRALLFNLLQRKPEYKKSFENRQKIMSEGAFPDILVDQLAGATVFKEVYYKDPASKQWAENDTLALVDDVLYLIEAKAGAAATIASPALDFKRHVQSVQDLVLKAYSQCKRFFDYLNTAEEVPLFHHINGKYVECGRIRRSDYRLMLPIGLTVESFTPFSTFCKNLPQIEPLLGKHAFLSLSIDDLFVLRRILPTPGLFAHYMEVRQAVAGMRHAHLFDEFDHLGAYITKNRVDQEIAEQLENTGADFMVWENMSKIVDEYFMDVNWETNPVPTQEFPDEILKLLETLDATRAPGWLSAESHIRNYGEQARKNLAQILSDLGKTIEQHPTRYFTFAGDAPPLFVWMQNTEHEIEWDKINDKASAASICAKSSDVAGNPIDIGILIEISTEGIYKSAHFFKVYAPSKQTKENAHIFDDAKQMRQRTKIAAPFHEPDAPPPRRTKKIGRNDPCPCGSGLKYKKCHGR